MTATPVRVRWKVWLRTLHTYFSLFGLTLLLFFAATGFVMNHEDWFEVPSREQPTAFGQVPLELLQGPDELAIVELLRERYGAEGPLARFETDDEELRIAFRKPGRVTDAVIQRSDGWLTVDVEIDGLLETMTQLHKGKRSGIVGGLLVDFVALTLAITALGGLTLWTTLPKRRVAGLAAIGAGVLFVAALWWHLVV